MRGIPIADWKGLVLPKIKEQLEDFTEQGFPPTLRGMYYTLLDLKVFPKAEAAYRALSSHTSRWRENGTLPRDCFADHSRGIIQDFEDGYVTIQDYIDRGIIHLEYAKDNYNTPRWHKQPHHVEIWLEKDAAVETFRFIVKDRHVIVVPNRGHSSVAFFDRNVGRLREKQAEGKQIHIQYYGDADPSGEAMDKVYKRKFLKYGLYNVDFKRLAVTKEQMERFQLLHNPDPATLQKLKKDSNKSAFKLKYNLKSDDELFAIQLEAMQTPKVRAYLKELVLNSMDRLFDQNTFKQVQSEQPTSETIIGYVQRELDALQKRLVMNNGSAN